MKRRTNNVTLILLAVLSFFVGVMLIGAYGLQLRHREEAKAQAIILQEQEKKQRQEELAKAQAEEEERKKNATENKEDDKAENMPGIDVDKALGSDLSHIDLSSYVQDMDGLISQLNAKAENNADETRYFTADKAIVIEKIDTKTHQIEIKAETAYSLYHVFVGMLQKDATDYLQSRGYKRSNRNGDTCYKIDDYKVLFLKFDGTRVVNLRMEVTSAAQEIQQ